MVRQIDLTGGEPEVSQGPTPRPVFTPSGAVNRDHWVAACGGTETPMTIGGRRLWYMWNRRTGQHAYLDMDRDVFLTDAEAWEIIHAR